MKTRQPSYSPSQRWQRRTLANTILLGVAVLSFTLITATGVWGQDSSAETPPTAESPLEQTGLPLNIPDFSDLLAPNVPQVSREPVRLDGRRLFTIAIPEIVDNATDMNEASSRLRVDIIENRLEQIARSNFDPASLQVTSAVEGNSRLPVIEVEYDVEGEIQQEDILTVTSLDAQIHGTDAETLAAQLTQVIESALLQAQQERQPEALPRQSLWAALIILLMVLGSLILTYLQQHLQRERRRLAHANLEAQSSSPSDSGRSAPNSPPRITTALLQHEMANRQRYGMNDIQRRVLQIVQVVIWIGGIFLILGLFPQIRWIRPWIINWLQIPFKIILVIYFTYLLIRVSDVLVDRLFLVLQNSASIEPAPSQRIALRFSTFSRVLKSIAGVVLVGAAVLISLSIIGIEVGPLLAGAGIIGLAISFASQSLIKDVINGFLILLEDQYGVGDVIVVGDVAGLVENMNLRITQLRNEEGRLITIPNGVISIVQNLSKEWSRVDLQVNVAYSTDIDKALEVIDDVAQGMSHEMPWKDLILEKPSLLGIDRLDHTGALVRLWIKTRPLKQWDVAREYRRRLKRAFDKAGIPIGIPQQSLLFSSPLDLENEHPPKDSKNPFMDLSDSP